jgi:hypothetical protein
MHVIKGQSCWFLCNVYSMICITLPDLDMDLGSTYEVIYYIL